MFFSIRKAVWNHVTCQSLFPNVIHPTYQILRDPPSSHPDENHKSSTSGQAFFVATLTLCGASSWWSYTQASPC